MSSSHRSTVTVGTGTASVWSAVCEMTTPSTHNPQERYEHEEHDQAGATGPRHVAPVPDHHQQRPAQAGTRQGIQAHDGGHRGTADVVRRLYSGAVQPFLLADDGR